VEDRKKNGWWLATALGVGAVTAYTIWGKPKPEYDFEGKVILITGGSRGLGLVLIFYS
jgi:NADPH:quinone reductase-like Zn-dependent oxidoreductase